MTSAERLIFDVAERLGMMAATVAAEMTSAELIAWASLPDIDTKQKSESGLKMLSLIARAKGTK